MDILEFHFTRYHLITDAKYHSYNCIDPEPNSIHLDFQFFHFIASGYFYFFANVKCGWLGIPRTQRTSVDENVIYKWGLVIHGMYIQRSIG